jgi:hypothetical protein
MEKYVPCSTMFKLDKLTSSKKIIPKQRNQMPSGGIKGGDWVKKCRRNISPVNNDTFRFVFF